MTQTALARDVVGCHDTQKPLNRRGTTAVRAIAHSITTNSKSELADRKLGQCAEKVACFGHNWMYRKNSVVTGVLVFGSFNLTLCYRVIVNPKMYKKRILLQKYTKLKTKLLYAFHRTSKE